MTDGFGFTKEDHVWNEYIDKYVILFPQHGSNFAGKFIGLQDGYAVLNPFQGGEWDSEKGFRRKMVHQNVKVRVDSIIAIEPMTKKSLEASCKYLNKQDERARDYEEKEKEPAQK